MIDINKTLGEAVRDRRVEKDLSLRDLAKLIDIAPSYLSDIENDRRVPSEEIIHNIAQALDMDADDLMARSGRLGEEAERYMKKHPAAGILFRKISTTRLNEDDLRKLLKEADRLGQDREE